MRWYLLINVSNESLNKNKKINLYITYCVVYKNYEEHLFTFRVLSPFHT